VPAVNDVGDASAPAAPGVREPLAAPGDPSPGGDALRWLLDVSHTLPPAHLGEAMGQAMGALGASSSCLFLVDHDGRRMRPFGPDVEGHESLDVDATVAGRAFAWERTHTAMTAAGVRLWVPLIDGTARLGVVAVDLPEDRADDDTVAEVEVMASLAAELLISKGAYTDAFELVRRHRDMTLAAELQRSILPPVALVTADVAVAGVLQPAYEVAGDSFDYALDDNGLYVVVIDSVGHDLRSSMISHLVQGSLRNSRRNGLDIVDAYQEADEALASLYPDQRFATAAFGRLEPDTGRFRWVAAGHPPPLLVRSGRVVGEAVVVPALPIGLRGGTPPVNEVVLEPGDALLIYTDGVTEGGARGGERFGLDRLVDMLGRTLLSGMPPAELLRRLAIAVLEHAAHELHDDMTVVLVQRRTGTS
jgi:serine phosphatase RsbU (regulator of sigma subunit)